MKWLKIIIISGVLFLPNIKKTTANIYEKETLEGIIEVLVIDDNSPLEKKIAQLGPQINALRKLLDAENSYSLILDADLEEIDLGEIEEVMESLEKKLEEDEFLKIVPSKKVLSSKDQNIAYSDMVMHFHSVNVLLSQYCLGVSTLKYLSRRGMNISFSVSKELMSYIKLRSLILG